MYVSFASYHIVSNLIVASEFRTFLSGQVDSDPATKDIRLGRARAIIGISPFIALQPSGYCVWRWQTDSFEGNR